MDRKSAVFTARLITYIVLIILLIAQTSCGKDEKNNDVKKSDESFFAMDTYVTVTAYGENSDEAVKAAENKITALEKLWSVTDQNSESLRRKS